MYQRKIDIPRRCKLSAIFPNTVVGSCHCGAVRFSLQSSTPVPFALCLCSICRKVGGTGGSINLGGHFDTLKVEKGNEHISVYKAVMNRDTPEEHIASSERNFCSKCSSMLWLYDKTWPELVHPFAAAIDSPLQIPEKMVCLMTESKPEYVRLPEGPKHVYTKLPAKSLEDWHKENNLYVE
ncbi:Mss4-like protein [Mycena alexandri]|uniref:Mss4-like protein n=1 Tax=Mycena alexandri TaxID=1745969 RepID=A0AAD6WV23_9AGAR|nr:Mss4-like protein [Mycena alexandri]